MSHRAFVFDEAAYRAELSSLLNRAVDDDDPSALRTFLAARGTAPAPDLDAAALAQQALAVFAEPDDIGLGESWRTIRAHLADLYPEGRVFVTGGAVGSLDNVFVQSADYVAGSVRILERLLADSRRDDATIRPALAMLQTAATAGKGLLISAF